MEARIYITSLKYAREIMANTAIQMAQAKWRRRIWLIVAAFAMVNTYWGIVINTSWLFAFVPPTLGQGLLILRVHWPLFAFETAGLFVLYRLLR